MADLRDVLKHLVTFAEGYATPALRQEHLDVIDEAFSPAPPEAQQPEPEAAVPPTVPDAPVA